MISRTTRQFRRQMEKLPKDVNRQAIQAFRLFQKNPNHRSLHFKKVHSRLPIYSARININYRAVGIFEGETIVWFWVGSHSKYEEILKQL